MRLIELIKNIYPLSLPKPFHNIEIQQISDDSRKIGQKCLFIAVTGVHQDGHKYIPEAIHKGVSVVVQNESHQIRMKDWPSHVCLLKVKDTKSFLRLMAPRFFNHPLKKITLIGVTGTNGKTTTTYLLESIFKTAGHRCGVIGTVQHRIDREIIPSSNTTPGFLDLQDYLARMVNKKIHCCFLDASSHALDKGRVDQIPFKKAVYTNLTQEHLDYHPNMEHYFKSKSILFSSLAPRAYAVINQDDEYGRRLRYLTRAKLMTYGISPQADVMAKDIRMEAQGSSFIVISRKKNFPVQTSLVGLHNIYNILAAVAVSLGEQLDVKTIQGGIQRLIRVPGRLEPMSCGQDFYVFVDYAHTDDALMNVLKTLHAIYHKRVILVFGCGGNRDQTKRPRMGRVACHLADFTFLTNDNPRREDPQDIIKQIVLGFKNDHYKIILDRKIAIESALEMARREDVVLIAGKGHENYQIFQDKTVPFDDCQVVCDYLRGKLACV